LRIGPWPIPASGAACKPPHCTIAHTHFTYQRLVSIHGFFFCSAVSLVTLICGSHSLYVLVGCCLCFHVSLFRLLFLLNPPLFHQKSVGRTCGCALQSCCCWRSARGWSGERRGLTEGEGVLWLSLLARLYLFACWNMCVTSLPPLAVFVFYGDRLRCPIGSVSPSATPSYRCCQSACRGAGQVAAALLDFAGVW
jgi:hypothetical protein